MNKFCLNIDIDFKNYTSKLVRSDFKKSHLPLFS